MIQYSASQSKLFGMEWSLAELLQETLIISVEQVLLNNLFIRLNKLQTVFLNHFIADSQEFFQRHAVHFFITADIDRNGFILHFLVAEYEDIRILEVVL